MKRPFFTIVRSPILAAVCVAVTASAQPGQHESSVAPQLQGLESRDLPTREHALSALLAQSGIKGPGPCTKRVTVNSLLRTHPQQAEKIRTTLIAALEKEGAEFARPSTQDAQTTEEQAEYVAALTEAVAALQDPRAVNGLVLALPAGSIPGLVDICPAAAEALIERVHEPDVYEEGQPMGYRGLPITALAWCLQRPAMMRTNPEMVDKIRVGLLGMLHDPNPIVRGSAAAALSPLRMEPQVQEALRTLAASDPYRGTGYYGTGYDDAGIGTPDGGFMVREAAAKSLSPLPGFSFYVTRTQGARVCRMQEASEAPIEDRFMGPEREAMLRSEMCSHYDPTGQDPSLCWKVEPANVCSQ